MGLLQKLETPYLYTVFRVLVGVLFFLHGYMKIVTNAMPVTSFMGFIGLVELLVGLGVFLGVLTRLAALSGAIVMIGAFVKVHLPQGLNPLANGGEPAVLFLAAFLVLLAYGNGKLNLEQYLWKKEIF